MGLQRLLTVWETRRGSRCCKATIDNVIASLITKFDQFLVEVNKIKPDFIVITESWLTASVMDAAIHINGYQVFRKDRLYRRGGGIVIYIMEEIANLQVRASIYTDLMDEEIEALWINISIGSFNFILGGIYRPPSYERGLQATDHKILNVLWALDVLDVPVILAGDFNLPGLRWASVLDHPTPLEREYYEVFLGSRLVQFVKKNLPGTEMGKHLQFWIWCLPLRRTCCRCRSTVLVLG